MCFALHYTGCVSLTKVALAAFEKLASCFTPQVVAHDKTRIEEAHRCCAMFLYHLDGGDLKRGRAQYKWQGSSNSSRASNQAQIPYQRKKDCFHQDVNVLSLICNRCFMKASTPFTFALQKRRVLFYLQPTAQPGVKEADTLFPHCQPQGFYLGSAARAPVCYGDSTSSSALLCDLHLFIQSLYYRFTNYRSTIFSCSFCYLAQTPASIKY